MSSHPRMLPTPEEYLMLERAAETRSEYLAGEIFALSGASREHNIIAANVIRILGNQLIDRPCMVYPSDMRVKISPVRKYTYPDIAVIKIKINPFTRKDLTYARTGSLAVVYAS